MLNAMRAWNAWFGLSSQFAMLGLEAQRVIALRLMRLAAGGALAESETSRMITEKVAALGEAQTAAAMATLKGRDSRQVAWKVLRVYRKRPGGGLRSELRPSHSGSTRYA
jgi:hypothetical protein